jgi:hypothetical protein
MSTVVTKCVLGAVYLLCEVSGWHGGQEEGDGLLGCWRHVVRLTDVSDVLAAAIIRDGARTSETSVQSRQNVWCNISED